MGMFDLGWLMTGANQQLSSSVVNGGRRRREEGRSEAHPSIHQRRGVPELLIIAMTTTMKEGG